MGAVAMWHVNCDAGPYASADHPVRAEDCHGMTEDTDTRGEAQRVARKAGWLVGAKGQDNLCPPCREANGK